MDGGGQMSKKKRRLLFIGLIAILIILAIMAIFFIMQWQSQQHQTEPLVPQSSENIQPEQSADNMRESEDMQQKEELQEATQEDDIQSGAGPAGPIIEIGEGKHVVERMMIPWSMDMSEEIIFVTERGGTVAEIQLDEDRVFAQSVTRLPLHSNEDIHHRGEGGLLGMVLAPDFESSGEAYFYYTYTRGRTIYNGGRMALSPDGYLFVTTGDANDTSLSQDVTSLAGKILRMSLEGQIPDIHSGQQTWAPSNLAYDQGSSRQCGKVRDV